MKKIHLIFTLFLAMIGLILSIILAKIGINILINPAHKSFCNINETFNCDTVALSSYATHFGIPNFVYGILFYLIIIFFSSLNLFAKENKIKNFFTYLYALSALAVFGSIYLFTVSHFVIKSLCILCIMVYTINILLLIVASIAEEWDIKKMYTNLKNDLKLFFGSEKRTISFIVLFALAISSLFYFNENPLLGKVTKQENNSTIEVDYSKTTGQRMVTGPEDVPDINILMFTDFECAFCGKTSEEIKKLIKNNPEIRLVFKHYPLDQSCNQRMKRPFHKNACDASLYSTCAAEQGKFWEYHDLLFQNQSSLDNESLKSFAEQLKLDLKQFNQCVDSKKYLDKIITDLDEGAALKIEGTPTFFIEGKKIDGYRPVEEFQKIIDEIKAEKEKEYQEYLKKKEEYLKNIEEKKKQEEENKDNSEENNEIKEEKPTE